MTATSGVRTTTRDGLAPAPAKRTRRLPGTAPCPNEQAHTPIPNGYVTWHEFASEMADQGWSQTACASCHAFVIWVPPRDGQ